MTTKEDTITAYIMILALGYAMLLMGYYETSFVIFTMLAMYIPLAIMRRR